MGTGKKRPAYRSSTTTEAPVVTGVRLISDGTLLVLTGKKKYSDIEKVQGELILFTLDKVENGSLSPDATWMDAWNSFMKESGIENKADIFVSGFLRKNDGKDPKVLRKRSQPGWEAKQTIKKFNNTDLESSRIFAENRANKDGKTAEYLLKMIENEITDRKVKKFVDDCLVNVVKKGKITDDFRDTASNFAGALSKNHLNKAMNRTNEIMMANRRGKTLTYKASQELWDIFEAEKEGK
jgi:hypothetical protein